MLVVSNHRSFVDPSVVGSHLRHPMTYFARRSLWKYPIVGQLLRLFSGIPVDRNRPTMETMKSAVAVLRNDISVLLFPEGTRSRTGRMLPLRQGAGMFARRAGVAVLPIYIEGAASVWPAGRLLPYTTGKLRLHIGPLLQTPDPTDRRADQRLSESLERWFIEREKRILGEH
jgi:1-acyl-sn-glycerol-3-phosphate acyltransferase